jgi:serine/threonine protein kinase
MARPFQPTHFGRYLLTERIAVGGMAEIFYAKVFGAMGFEKALVIKRILPQFAEDAEFLRMFITEAKLVCHLEHPNIVQVHELGENEGQYYISMEFVNGIDGRQLWRTLAKRKQRLPGVLALFVVSEFLKGLDYAHRAVGPNAQLLGVVHRDVSPSNILISFRGDVKIGDFGIALVQQESKTQAGVLKGKFGYMSPEQVAGLRVDHRSDIFAAGIVLAELLLGRRLFLGASDFETLDKVMNVRLDVLEEHEHALPAEAVRIVRQALQRDVNDRYQSAREFYEDINEYLYQQGHRITNETLAAFMAEHVTPYLALSRGSEASESSESKSWPGESPGGRSPVVKSNIIPGDLELTPSSDDLQGDQPADAEPAAGGPAPAGPASAATDEDRPAVAAGAPADAMPAPAPAQPTGAAFDIGQGSEVPIDDPAFSSMPMVEIEAEDDLVPGESFRTTTPSPPSADSEGAGEELDLDAFGEDEEEEFYRPSINLDQFDQAHGLVEKQLDVAEAEEPGREPDFKGSLSSRTVTKVLFRFAVVEEGGLLVLTGPKHTGKQAELLEWLHDIQMRANATITTEGTTARTCEIHLLNGQPHLASADRSEEALIAYLIRSDILSSHRVEMAIRNNPHRRPIAALLAAGAIAPLQVSRHVVAFVLESIFDTFGWIDGTFAFYRDREAPGESFPTGQDAMELVVNGVSHLSEAFIDGYFQQLSGYSIVANRMPPARIERFHPDPLLLEVYRSLGTAQPVDDAVTACGLMGEPLKAMQALYLLIECELASLV